ncbi:MAG: protein kinase [Actinomycetaceae bacterium]|nr:protein kinase [Actinomycetaceae bacterium]
MALNRAFSAGDWVGGYELRRQLGSGGAGVVWEVCDEGGNRFALKILHPGIAADPTARQRLEREANTVNRVRDDGVARVVDLETEYPVPFVVTELVDGVSLRDYLAKCGAMPLPQVLSASRSLHATLRKVHAAGVIHRDLKPSNIIMSSRGPVLIDFGIAQFDDDERLTSAGLVSGTPGWVEAEVLAGRTPDAQSDWWAWSALVLTMLTGRPPFGGGGFEAMVTRLRTNEPDDAGVDPFLAQVLRASLGPREFRPPPGRVLAALDLARSGGASASDTAAEPGGMPDASAAASLAAATSLGVGSVTPLPEGGSPDTLSAASPVESDLDATDLLTANTDVLSSLAADAAFETAHLRSEAEPPTEQLCALPPVNGAEPPVAPLPHYPDAQLPDCEPPTRQMPSGYLVQEHHQAPDYHQEPDYQPAPGEPAEVPPDFDAIAPYTFAPVKGASFLLLVLALALPTLPLVACGPGWLLMALLLSLAMAVGYARHWMHMRRVTTSGPRPSDVPLAVLRFFPELIRALMAVTLSAGAATLVALGAWSLWQVNTVGTITPNPLWDLLQQVPAQGGGWLTWPVAFTDATGVEPVILGLGLWGSGLFAILVTRIGPGGWNLSQGARLLATALFPWDWLRAIVATFLLGAGAAVVWAWCF